MLWSSIGIVLAIDGVLYVIAALILIRRHTLGLPLWDAR